MYQNKLENQGEKIIVESTTVIQMSHKLDDNVKSRTLDVTESTNVRSFEDLHLGKDLTKGLSNAGFFKPSPVQWAALPMSGLGVDLVVQAKSGTGKTLVFVVSALKTVKLEVNFVQILLIAPTREIAVQNARAVLDVAKGAGINDVKVHTFIGGMSLTDDHVKSKKCHIAIGTPGRIRALLESKHIKPEAIRLFVLDEADKLMEPAFKPDLTWIFNQLPLHKQVIALSATYPKDLSNVVTKFMSSPQHVRLNPSQSNVLIGVSQFWMSCEFHPLQHIEADRKFKVLLEILNKVSFSQCLIFSNYSTRAEAICEKLDANGWPVEFLAGTMEQKNRLRALNNLKQFSCRVLITTDLSARGIDSQYVNLVINLEVPWESSTYLHRIGRSGRFGSYGIAITLASKGKETQFLQNIVHETNSPIYEIEKLNSEEYDLPDLWKLKQTHTLELLLENKRILEGLMIEETQAEELELEVVQEEMLTNVDFIEEASENKVKIENVLQESYGENNEEFYHSTEYGEVLEEIESEIPPLLKEEFILESFCKAVGCNVNYNKCSAESNKATADAENFDLELKEIFDKYNTRSGEELVWPLDLSQPLPPKIETIPISEKDLQRLSYLKKKALKQKMEEFEKQVEENKAIISQSDLKSVIDDMLNGKDLKKCSEAKEVVAMLDILDDDRPDPLTWYPIDPSSELGSYSIDSPQVLFDKERLNVDLDDDYNENDPYDEDQELYDDSTVTISNFFPDPDAFLPGDLHQIHKNEWLKMQYELWIQKVASNRDVIERFHLKN